jgi:hypothetical protein
VQSSAAATTIRFDHGITESSPSRRIFDLGKGLVRAKPLTERNFPHRTDGVSRFIQWNSSSLAGQAANWPFLCFTPCMRMREWCLCIQWLKPFLKWHFQSTARWMFGHPNDPRKRVQGPDENFQRPV